MITVVVEQGKKKKMKVNPSELISNTLQDIVEEKCPGASIVGFDGTHVEYMCGDNIELEIDENELIDKSIKEVAKKRLKKRGDLQVRIKN